MKTSDRIRKLWNGRGCIPVLEDEFIKRLAAFFDCNMNDVKRTMGLKNFNDDLRFIATIADFKAAWDDSPDLRDKLLPPEIAIV